jgi:MinD superfamily P-loop ATPase
LLQRELSQVWGQDDERINMIISVASGKGGTGKTLVATSLALSLKDRERVQLLDCDVEEPNDHIFLKPVITRSETVSIMVPMVNEDECTYCSKCAEVCAYHAIAVLPRNVLVFPHLCHGCGACSYLCPEKAISEEPREIGVVETGHSNGIAFVQGRLNIGEPMPTPVIRKVKEKANHDGIVITDVSPGTSCPVVESIRDSDFCLLVTEPTPFGLSDLILAVETVKALNVPCGVIINRAGVGDGKVADYCLKERIPILRVIPLDDEIAQLYSRGITLVEGMPQWQEGFRRVFDGIQEIVDERSRSLKR